MNCYNHPDVSAVGLCKVCNKGLCSECSVDLGHSLACKNKHEDRANSLDMIISTNAKAYEQAPGNSLIMPAFFIFMGAVIAGYCWYLGRGIMHSSSIMGMGFIFFGVLIWYKNRKIYRK